MVEFNYVSGPLATRISLDEGVSKMAAIGENERDEIILFAADYWGGKHKLQTKDPLVFSKMICAHSSVGT